MERGQFNDALLIAYAAGEADPRTREAIEAAMARDEVIRARVEAHRRRRASHPESGRVTQGRTARSPLAAKPAEIVDLATVRALKTASKSEAPPRRAWVQWSALAICVAVGVILARGLGSADAAPLIAAPLR
jgi:anti-sigma factor RsiW